MRYLRHQYLARESGMALLIVLGVLSGLTIAGGALLSLTNSNSSHAERSVDTMLAQNVAEAGMNYARSILWNAVDPTDPAAVGSGNITLESGTANYSGTLSGTVWTLTGTGFTTNSAGGPPITKTVSSQVQLSSSGGTGGPPLAIFAADTDCGDIAFKTNGDDTTVAGRIRSNGDFNVDGKNFSSAAASAHGPPCKVEIGGENVQLKTVSESFGPVDGGLSDATLDGGAYHVTPDGETTGLELNPTAWAWPVDYRESDFTCTFTRSTFDFNTDGALIPPGVYCATESFTINGSNMSGSTTVLAPKIEVNGEGQVLSPYVNDVLFFATGTEDMKLSGSGYTWAGTIFHPGGCVSINGDYASHLSGMIAAREVTLNGAGFTMSGHGPPLASGGGDGITLENVAGSFTVG